MKKITIFCVFAALLLILAGTVAVDNEPTMIVQGEPVSSLMNADGDTKVKTIYYHNATSSFGNYNMNTTMGVDENVVLAVGDTLTLTWDLEPAFASDFVLNGSLSTYIWIKLTDTAGETNKLNEVNIVVNEIDPAGSVIGGAIWTETEIDITGIPGHFVELSWQSSHVGRTINKNNSLRISMELTKPADTTLYVAFGSDSFPSRLEVSTDTYMRVRDLRILNSTYQENTTFPLTGDKIIYFNATVTSPFGGYDIWDVQLTLEGPDGAVFTDESMTWIEGNHSTYWNNYSFVWDYSGAAEGLYTVTVSAIDQTGFNYRYPDNPEDETYGGHLDSMTRSFSIALETFRVYLRTIDSQDAPLYGARIDILSESEVYITHNLTNPDGVASFNLSSGNYTIKTYWQDVLVNQTSLEVQNDILSPIDLNCTVYSPTYEVVDFNDEPVVSANIYLGHPNGSLMILLTDTNGTVELEQMAGGFYNIEVEWMGKEVNTTSHTLNSNDIFRIEATIYRLTIRTYDTRNEPMPDVQVIVSFNDTQATADAQLTNNLGEMYSRLPGTQAGFGYDIVCKWHGVFVGNVTDVPLESNDEINITLDIFYVDFHTVDRMGYDLEYTRLLGFTASTGSLTNTNETGLDGRATMRLPAGLHTIEAYWRGILVNTTDIDVFDGLEVEIVCDVYHVVFNVVDNRSVSLENAHVIASHPDTGILSSNHTDADGHARARLPGTDVTISVTWKGVSVFSDSVFIDSNGDLEIKCSVFYLSVEVYDDLGIALENARVDHLYGDTLLATETSDADGITGESRLPGTQLTLKIWWKNICVFTEDHELENDDTFIATTSVYHVDIEVLDSMGEALDDASIRIYHNGMLMDSDTSDSDGLAFARLPGETHRFNIYWKDVLVYDAPLEIARSGKLTIEVNDVYHVTFLMTDSRDVPVSGVSVILDLSGDQFASGITDASGHFTTRIPTPFDSPGDVHITAYWKNVMVFDSTVQISSGTTIEAPMVLDLEIYYMEYTIVDAEGMPLKNARITVLHDELPEGRNALGELYTDSNGFAIFRLPRGEQVAVANWRDTIVDTTTVSLTEDETITVSGSVYYLNIQVKDDNGNSLEHAFVTIHYPDGKGLYHSVYTDQTGSIRTRVPAASWEIRATWLERPIYSAVHEITSEESTWSIDASSEVYQLTLITRDSKGELLSDVHLIVKSGNDLWSGYTENGEISFRLPVGDDYSVTAYFKTTYQMSDVDLQEDTEIVLQDNSEESIDFQGYPIPIYSTNMFFVLLGLILLILVFAVVYMKTPKPTSVAEEEFDDEEFEEDEELTEEEPDDEEFKEDEELTEEEPDEEEGLLEDEYQSDEEF